MENTSDRTQDSDLQCPKCNKTFKTKNTMNVHMKTKCSSSFDSHSSSSNSESPSSKFVCEYCNKSLSSRQMLKYHLDICFQARISNQQHSEKDNNVSLLKYKIKSKVELLYSDFKYNADQIRFDYNSVLKSLRNGFENDLDQLEHITEPAEYEIQLNHLKNEIREEIINQTKARQELDKQMLDKLERLNILEKLSM